MASLYRINEGIPFFLTSRGHALRKASYLRLSLPLALVKARLLFGSGLALYLTLRALNFT